MDTEGLLGFDGGPWTGATTTTMTIATTITATKTKNGTEYKMLI
jgi:hypothetical protein